MLLIIKFHNAKVRKIFETTKYFTNYFSKNFKYFRTYQHRGRLP